ncbi:MAG: cytochrome oxidase [Planctomycetes bacterium]|nr:cytochrome oxidase [Planctomycetota bacterium]
MDVLILLVFVSIVFVAGSLLLLFFSLHQRDFEHAERLSLLPLLDSNGAKPAASADAEGMRASVDTVSVPSKP